MKTVQQNGNGQPRRINVQPHRLGMGWHYLWRYDPPIEHVAKQKDGSLRSWREDGETSEGCIMWLADSFATQKLGTTARDIFRLAYARAQGRELDDDWLATQALRDDWGPHTVLPKQWGAVQVRALPGRGGGRSLGRVQSCR